MSKIADFIIENNRTIVLIYAIIAALVIIVVNVYFWKISFELGKEIKEEIRYYDCYNEGEANFGKWIVRATGLILSIPVALLWCFMPLILGGLLLYDAIEQKKPELFGNMAEEFDKETEEKK